VEKNFAFVLIGKSEKYMRIFANRFVNVEFTRLFSVDGSVGVERNMYLITNAVALYGGGGGCEFGNLPFDVVYHFEICDFGFLIFETPSCKEILIPQPLNNQQITNVAERQGNDLATVRISALCSVLRAMRCC
jgi:hypothetical protein